MGKNSTDKGVFTWGIFTAIMIVVIVAAVLIFVFKVDLGFKDNHRADNKNAINESMVEKGYIIKEDGTKVILNNVEFKVEEAEQKIETPSEPSVTDAASEVPTADML